MDNFTEQMFVIKRDGTKQSIQFDKITKRIMKLVNKEEKNKIVPTLIAQKVITSIYSGITTEELDLESAKVCMNLITTHPIYGELAGRILVSNLHKKTKNSFVDKMNIINENNENYFDAEWIKWINNNSLELENIIDYTRDFKLDFFAFKTLERAYLTKNLKTGEIYERPQDVFLRVASFICCGDLELIKKTYDLISNKYYTHATPTLFNSGMKRSQLSSCFLIQMKDDSIDGIYDTLKDCAKISKWAGGIGLHTSNIRAKGSHIRGTNGTSNGIIPMLKNFNETARYVDQGGGKRKGSIAIYLEPHHPDIFEFLELKKNFGAETERARDLFLALWVSDLFMEQVEKDGDWHLFCPDEAPGLNEVYGEEYNNLYWKYVEEKRYKRIVSARKLMEKIFDSQLETGVPYMLYKDSINNKSNQKNIGVIKSSNLCAEIVEVSNNEEHAVCNLASIAINHALVPFKSTRHWTIYTKQDCKYCKWSKNYMDINGYKYDEKFEFDTEILKQIKKNKVKCEGDTCTFENITYPQIFYGKTYIGGFDDMIKFTADKYDYDKLWETAYTATVNLDKVIDKNYYPTSKTKCSNMRNRPIGLGIQGLADTLVKMKINFESDECVEFNKLMMETIYHASLTASKDIAKNRYELCKKLQNVDIPYYYEKSFKLDDSELNEIYHTVRLTQDEQKLTDYYGAYSKFIGSPISQGVLQFDMWNDKPSRNDWDELKEEIMKYGVRNSLVTALMPTASTSQIMGNNECFEWFTNNIYSRRTLAGDFTIINKHLIEDLINIGEWNNDVKQMMVADDGSIKRIPTIPQIYKELYKTIWEIKQIWVLKNARARAPFVDQTQSMNIFMAVPDYKKLNSCHFWGWKNGLKTGMYYLRSRAATGAVKVTIDPKIEQMLQQEEEICESCSA